MRPPAWTYRGSEDRRQPRAERKRDDARAVGDNESIFHDVKCVRLAFERLEDGRNILCAPDFDVARLQGRACEPWPEPRRSPARTAR